MRRTLLTLLAPAVVLAGMAQMDIKWPGPFVPPAAGHAATYDTASYATIGANSTLEADTTVGSGLSKQGLFLFIAENDSSSYVIQSGGLITTNSSGLVPLIWQKVGSTVSGNGAYHGECWMATGGGAFSGAISTWGQLTGATGNASGAIQYSLGNVNQGAISSAGSRTCSSATSDGQSVSLSSGDMAVFTDFDTNNNNSISSGCTTSTDLSNFSNTGYSSAHCTTTPTSSLTWSGYGSTSVAVNQAAPHDNGSSAPSCAFEGYNPFTGGTSGNNAVSYLSTVDASEYGTNEGTWSGGGTLNWGSTDTGLLNNTATLCGNLTSYSSGTTSLGLVETGTGSAVANYLQYTLGATPALASLSRSIKFCTDAPSSDSFIMDVAYIGIGSDYINVQFQCNGSSCFWNSEAPGGSTADFVSYTTGGSCSAGGSGWVTIAQQINETGSGCSGKPCSYVKIYSNTGSLLGTASNPAAGTWGGLSVAWIVGHLGSDTIPSGVHIYYAKDIHNYSGTFPPDM
jgi:hypothetical protein